MSPTITAAIDVAFDMSASPVRGVPGSLVNPGRSAHEVLMKSASRGVDPHGSDPARGAAVTRKGLPVLRHRPGRDDSVDAGIGDQLAQMLVGVHHRFEN